MEGSTMFTKIFLFNSCMIYVSSTSNLVHPPLKIKLFVFWKKILNLLKITVNKIYMVPAASNQDFQFYFLILDKKVYDICSKLYLIISHFKARVHEI